MAFGHPFLFSAFLVALAQPCFSESVFDKNTQAAYQEVLKLKVNSARQLVAKSLAKDRDNACALLVANYADCITLLITDDPAQYIPLMAAQETRYERLDDLDEANPYLAYAKAEIRLHQALCKFKFGHEIQAGWDFRQAFIQLEEVGKKYPQFIPVNKSRGLLHVLLGAIPEKYHWVLKLAGLYGNVKLGVKELQIAATQPNPFREESEVMLLLLEEFSESSSGTALTDLKRTVSQHPDNLLYNFVYCWMLKKQKMGPEALRNVISRPQGEGYLPFAFYHHMAADLYLYRGEWEKSIAENKRYLQEYKGRHYLKDSRYKIYLAYQMLGQPAEAEKYLKAIPKAGAQLIEEDQHAQRLAEKPERLVKPLMRARLLHDGGYYTEALNMLEEFEKSRYARTKKDQLELIYRKARIYHALEQMDKAEAHYLRTITLSGTEPYYYAPNAALQLGYLYLDRRDKANARKYFQKALDYRGHEYESSIESKAKLALERL